MSYSTSLSTTCIFTSLMFLKIFHIYACKSSLFIFTDEHSGGLVAKSCPTLLLPHGPQPTRLLCTVSLYEKSWLIYFPNEWQLGFLFVCLFVCFCHEQAALQLLSLPMSPWEQISPGKTLRRIIYDSENMPILNFIFLTLWLFSH